ncbi:aspartoacylase [Synechococcus sp. CS-602]|uniref:aspartoacylase n=1 Tax=Synechococcaceae TaxID=1890426 RepID=UPI0008FF6C6A|nr:MULTISPECIES: aspartoacylase [Synechococcaceae]MCT4363925.1 aspartoacylase [Candidatus Regnicoccus frigidus MAG-AL1]APD49502.1 aspartoacylase [Synechococcus sp. SynAce01]MCT0201359.1 aspartoacylase [Synechococcus sp. CS-603]MCT0205909.1 aspartoacylase [Synechococcus sp. CS-602]MCT0246015.1 aspartoacylase [Synechococcus sp. CS-601]
MADGRVLVVGGTHGNERNAAWLLEHWRQETSSLQSHGLDVDLVIGNPAALAAGVRYLDRDLNRSFQPALLEDPEQQELEIQRARQLLAAHGPSGVRACPVVLDLHSTTAAMGNSLVLYGRRPADLALAAGIQGLLGLPIYLHEDDDSQHGFLIERWPCGLVIEVGPVPQGVITATICRQTQLAVEAALQVLADAQAGRLKLPARLIVHLHRGSLDLPRQADGQPGACLHPQRQHRDWQPLHPGDPLFLTPDGITLGLEATADSPLWPVFINEAAYGEKGIALSLTQQQHWPTQASWSEALTDLCAGLAITALTTE